MHAGHVDVHVRRLKKCKEHFKCPRACAKAVHCARTWRGFEPMLSYLFSKGFPKAGHHAKFYTAAWLRHVMLTNVPDTSATARRLAFGRAGDQTMMGELFKTSNTPAGLYTMHRTLSLFDLQFYMDGFTVYCYRTDKGIGNVVFVRRGECLPVYVHEDCGLCPSSKDVSKQHYLLVVGPGGVLVCAAMKSATKLWNKQNETPEKRKADSQFEFWYDLIPKMLTQGDLGDEDLEEVRAKMANRRWVVCYPSTHART